MKYKCIKPFMLEDVDDDGSFIDNSQSVIQEGTIWERVESTRRTIGAHDSIRLEDDDGRWMEIYENDITNNFVRV